jgi:PAS domain-containing protein
LNDFPIAVIATTTVSAALADWREQIRFLIAAAGLSVFVITGMLFLVVRKLSQQHRLSQQRLTQEKQRLDTAVNNMTQGLLLFDSSQRLVVCNQRYIEMYGLSTEVVEPGALSATSSLIERPPDHSLETRGNFATSSWGTSG